jgi:hypothetical protein
MSVSTQPSLLDNRPTFIRIIVHFLPECVFLKFNPLHTELNAIFHLLALLGAHHILHVGRLRVKGLQMAYLRSKHRLIKHVDSTV